MIRVTLDDKAVHNLVITSADVETSYPINATFIHLCKRLAPPTRDSETYHINFDGNAKLCMPYIFRFVEQYEKQPMNTDRIATPLKQLKLLVQVWYIRFVQEIYQNESSSPPSLVEEMIYIAYHLQMEPLLRLLCANMANKLVNRSPRQIFAMFQITRDRPSIIHPDHVLFNQKWKYGFRALDNYDTIHLPYRFIAIYDPKWRSIYPPYKLIYNFIPGFTPEKSIDDIAGAGHLNTIERLNHHAKRKILCTMNAVRFSILRGHVHMLNYFLSHPYVIVDCDYQACRPEQEQEQVYPQQKKNKFSIDPTSPSYLGASVDDWIQLATNYKQFEVIEWLREHAEDIQETFLTSQRDSSFSAPSKKKYHAVQDDTFEGDGDGEIVIHL